MDKAAHLVRLLIVGLLLGGLATPQEVQAAPANFEWGSFSAAGLTTFGVYDTDNATVLQTGDLAQLIWAGPDGVIDPPQSDGAPGDDDQLLQSSSINNELPLPPHQQNKGYISLKTYTFDTDDLQNSGTIYIRAWNASTPQTATAYGDSETTTLVGGTQWSAPRWYTGQGPTAVTLSFFAATPGEREILVEWETASEVDILGFNLYREWPEKQRIRLNDSLIASQVPGSPTGALYQFYDESVLVGITYCYWLEVVDPQGAAALHGPVSAGLPEGYRLYLPVILLGGR
jgi:hypothetical protein